VAPGSSVLAAVDWSSDDWLRSEASRCSPESALHVLRCAARLRLAPAGVSLRAAPGTHPPAAWPAPVAMSAEVFGQLRRDGLDPWLLDLGDGFPAVLDREAAPLASYGAAIETALRRSFPDERPWTLASPGTAIASAGAGSHHLGVGG
jgi:ornithine decarboxylase